VKGKGGGRGRPRRHRIKKVSSFRVDEQERTVRVWVGSVGRTKE